jgi:predicted transcriptional regulator
MRRLREQGLSYAAVGNVMGLSQWAVRWRLLQHPAEEEVAIGAWIEAEAKRLRTVRLRERGVA